MAKLPDLGLDPIGDAAGGQRRRDDQGKRTIAPTVVMPPSIPKNTTVPKMVTRVSIRMWGSPR